jgi:phage-related protein
VSLQAIIDFIVSLVQDVIAFIVDAVNALISVLNNVFGFIWTAIKDFAFAVVDIFQKAGSFFVHLWTDYLKPFVSGVLRIYNAIRVRLAAIFAPILRIIARVRAWFFHYIYPWIHLVQEILSRIRVILTLFRILGAKWAAKLDADIQRIQGYIAQFNAEIVGTLNQVTTWLNIAIDPLGIIRKDFFTGTLFSALGAVKRAAAFGNNRMMTGTEQKHEAQDTALVFDPGSAVTMSAGGGIVYGDALTRINDSASNALDYYGRAPALH